VIAGVLLVPGWAGAAPDSREDAQSRCESLARFSWPQLVVEAARVVPAGVVGPPTERAHSAAPDTPLPAHCLFRAILAPRDGAGGRHYGIGIDLRLPFDWNGRFAFEGGGGLDGIRRPAYGSVWGSINPPALTRGFAVVSTDGGHSSAAMTEAEWGLDQQARIDYAYNAVDKTTLIAKAVVAAFYGKKPDHSYFVGCSNGGRQAMMVTQRMPLEFDGVVAGDPSFRLTRTNIAEAWNEIVLARIAPKDSAGRPIISQAMTPDDLRLVSEAVKNRCDALDGLEDGIINDYRACRFDPAELTCRAGRSRECLAPAKVAALKALMTGPTDPQGHALYAAFPYDTGIADPAFQRMHFGTSTTGELDSADATLGFGALRYLSLTPPDPAFNPLQFDFAKDPRRTLETAATNDPDSVFLETFARRGKLILYHGISDQGLSPLDTADWYERVQQANGPNVRSWARLFLIPGMTHCAGGPATDRFDMLTAIQAWVEQGTAPDRIIASGAAFPGATRPLCPYPEIARYKGGNPKSASSFVCTK
jgi:feruloyl esterase